MCDHYDNYFPELKQDLNKTGFGPAEGEKVSVPKGYSMFMADRGEVKVPEPIKTGCPPAKESVNHPSHYNQGAIECIDAIESALSREEFIGFLRGNILKYNWRLRGKNGMEDVKKAEWYSERLKKTLTDEVK